MTRGTKIAFALYALALSCGIAGACSAHQHRVGDGRPNWALRSKAYQTGLDNGVWP